MRNNTHGRITLGTLALMVAALVWAGMPSASGSVRTVGHPASQPSFDRAVVAKARPAAQARLAIRHRGWVRLSNRTKGVTSAGTVYRTMALVRAERRRTLTTVRFRQVSGGRVTASRTVSFRALPRSWRSVRLSLRTTNRAGHLQTWVLNRAKGRNGLRVARVRLIRVRTVSSASVAHPVTGWKPDMQEDFNSLDPNRWNVKDNTTLSYESSRLMARNTTVNNGVLRIQGKKESVGGRSYTSGYVETMGKYTLPNYFRAEVRAKVPFEQGLWAAPLWFRPASNGDGEIDLVETYGRDRARPSFAHTIHTDYSANHKQVSIGKLFSSVSGASATDWHTYTIEKTPHRITMWVDGVQTAVFSPSNPAWYDRYYEVNNRWNLRVNLQIGGSWGGPPDSSTRWGGDASAMQLDYIRTWVPD